MNDYPPEQNPTRDQRARLDDWLSELALICRKYELIIDTCLGDTAIVDLSTSTIVGLDLVYLLNEKRRITGYDIGDSILDGVWMVRTDEGFVEQRRQHHQREVP